MPVPPTPDAIESRVVFRIYASTAIAGGLLVYMGGPLWLSGLHLPEVPFGRAAILRSGAAALVASGLCAVAFSRVPDAMARRRALGWFALAHLLPGGLFLVQWMAVLETAIPAAMAWTAPVIGAILLYSAFGVPGGRLARPRLTIRGADGTELHDVLALRSKPSMATLRSMYEDQIRQAVRQEERARLARDLHDAVKQQLFVIQTAAATAQARLDTDGDGTKDALEQVRTSAREAMTELEVMLDQLRASPIENAGLVASLKQQSEALGFRTGAEVTFELGALPGEHDVVPGAREAILRAGQEALANVARHARARTVQVSLGTEGSALVLTIRDDGNGVQPDAHRRGMGLTNMAARAHEIGGQFEMLSVSGRGTTIRFSVPCGPRPVRVYRLRAGVWSLVLVVAGALVVTGDRVQPVAAAIAAISAIAVARYSVAWIRVARAGSPP